MRILKIKNIASTHSGYTFRKNQKFDQPKKFKFLQVGDLNSDYQIATKKIERVIEVEPKEQYVLNPGDILFANKGEYNFASVVPEDIGDVLASSTFLILKNFSDSVLAEYLVWYINSSQGQKFIDTVRKGNTIPYISKTSFVDMPVVLPSIEKQKIIVEIDGLKKKEFSLRSKILEKRKSLIDKILVNHINKKSTW